MRSPAIAQASNDSLAAWLRVLTYSCEQENGGRVVGAVGWSDRAWMIACGVTASEVAGSSGLLIKDGEDIIVHMYPEEKEYEVRRNRESASKGGSSKTEAKTQAARINGTQGGRPKSKQNNPREREREGEGERKENGKLNGKDNQEPPPLPAASPRGVREGNGSDRFPTTEQSKRIASLFHRRDTTAWDEKEVSAYRKIGTVPPDDLTLIERYYAAERKKGDGENGGRHRRDLGTFLNNFSGELDRARAYKPFTGVSKTNIDENQWKQFLTSISRPYEPADRAMPFLRDDFSKWLRLQ